MQVQQRLQRPQQSGVPPPPPPYRAPPTPQNNAPYSKFNVSEPNIGMSQLTGLSPNSYRHTMTHDNSQAVQHGLRNLLQQQQQQPVKQQHQHHQQQQQIQPVKHSTMDANTQNFALQQLRNTLPQMEQQQQRLSSLQSKLPLPGDTYVSPDNLRDAASRIFTRNQDRSSFNHEQQVVVMQQQQQQSKGKTDTDYAKRQSYTNQSFRKATQEKIPPQVPPKPRSTSRERKEETTEVDNLEAELKHILHGGDRGENNVIMSTTPPLPALSPGPGSPDCSPSTRFKNNRRPDLLEGSSHNNNNNDNKGMKREVKLKNEDITSIATTTGLDLESVMGLQTDLTSDDDLSTTQLDMGDAQAIRKQLDSLEGMYSEVLKMLGLRKYGRVGPNESKLHHRMGGRSKLYGSMSSLPSVSSLGSRHFHSKDVKRGRDGTTKTSRAAGGGTSRDVSKTTTKRFQRLESHVVTLARSVAHLSSEMRTQQILMQQELESIRNEMQQIRHHHRQHPIPHIPNQGFVDPENFFGSANPKISPVHANRVKKLTKFFGDEPPLLRLFLKNLGYEKYAGVFEDSKIGLLELPYLSEERLEKLGVPLGPRMRILQEAKSTIGCEQNYNVYIL